jgi:hypothetical protein
LKKGRLRGGVSNMVNLKSTERVALYLGKMCRIAPVDSQAIRAKLLRQLDALFELAFSIAKGEVKRLRDDEGKEYSLSPRISWKDSLHATWHNPKTSTGP